MIRSSGTADRFRIRRFRRRDQSDYVGLKSAKVAYRNSKHSWLFRRSFVVLALVMPRMPSDGHSGLLWPRHRAQ